MPAWLIVVGAVVVVWAVVAAVVVFFMVGAGKLRRWEELAVEEHLRTHAGATEPSEHDAA
ncbi:hypothetical protein ACQCSX_07320 [Pseudarthrobacter sp. P1]|uniref:hypothetical protein n=1 Tax=Pseudarthrobacter sp. P1 TaxID=3418418 RepID=UPI003CFA1286